MPKRGQITVFVIVGILILATIFVAVYYSQLNTIKPQKQPEISYLKSYVENCLERSTVEGMYQVFAQGGYYEFPVDVQIFEFTEEDEKLQVPVYFQNEKAYLPALEIIEKEVAKATEQELLNCTGQFKSFEKQGYIISVKQQPTIEVRFTDRTTINLIYPLAIVKGEEKSEIKQFSVVIPFNFKEKYEMVNNYLREQEKDPKSFLMGELSFLAYEKDFNFGFKQSGDAGSEILVELSYDEKLKEEPLLYNFALFYGWIPRTEESPEISEPSFQLMEMPDWNIAEPGIYTYQVNAAGEGLIFETDSASLPIDPRTGMITLNTADFLNDEYIYYVKVSDKFNQSVMRPLFINLNANDGRLPVIEPIEKQTVKVGQDFYYKVNLLNNKHELFLFASETYLFQIDKKTGEIKFMPIATDLGVHTVRVDVENEYGRTWQRWELEVVK
ncbi:MAG: hypothetical protein AABW48_05285 [Nanoarchaeota archaeon]